MKASRHFHVHEVLILPKVIPITSDRSAHRSHSNICNVLCLASLRGVGSSDSGIVDIFYQFLLDTLKLIVLMGTCDVQETDFANDL